MSKKIKTPPPALRERIPEIATLADEVENLRGQHRTERQELTELEYALEAAGEQDTQAQADALRAGKADPGRKNSAKVEKQIEGKSGIVAALERASEDAAADLANAVNEIAEAQREKLLAEAEEQRVAAREILNGLREGIDARQRTLGLRRWLADPTREVRTGFGGVAGLTRPNGDAYGLGKVLDALAEALDPPKPPKPTNPHQLLHVTR